MVAIRISVCIMLLVVLLAAPGATAPRPGEAPADNGDMFVTEVPVRHERSDLQPMSTTSTSQTQDALQGDHYYDECDDSATGDIAEFIIADDGSAMVGFGWATCNGKPMGTSDDDMVVFAIDEDVEQYFAHDYVVVQYMDGYYEVFRTDDAAPSEEWVYADAGWGTIDRSDPGYTVGLFTIDAVAAEFPYEYYVAVQTFDASGEGDIIPNPGHPTPTFPSQCDTFVFSRKAVIHTDDLGAAVAAARAAGLNVQSVAPGIGTFTVGPVDRLRDLQLPGQISATRPTMYTLAAINDPEPSQWAIDQLELDAAWAARPSAPVEIAVVDSGVDGGRADLVGRVASGYDGVTGKVIPAGANSAFAPHGTAVAGIIGAARNNATEVAGVNDGAIIRPYRVMGHDGPCVESGALAAALDHVASVDTIRIVNMSLGGHISDPAVHAAIKRVAAAGKILVGAVGNDGASGPQANYPASHPEVIGIGATGPGPSMAPYSQPTSTEFVAPGGAGSLRTNGIATLDAFDGIAFGTGTSYAAPYASGALSLWLNGSHATTDQARTALASAAVDVPGTTADGGGLISVRRLVAGNIKDTPPGARSTDLGCPPGQVPEDGFADATGNAHEASIDCVVWWEVAAGTSASTYAPANPVNRAQMATFIARLIEKARPLAETTTDFFPDDNGNTHEDAINRLAAAGIVGGTGKGLYSPSAPVNRAQMATFLVRAYEYAAQTDLPAGGDYFADDDGNTHEDSVNAAAAAGFTGGTGAGYSPAASVSRAQMASFLARVLDLLVEQALAVPPPASS